MFLTILSEAVLQTLQVLNCLTQAQVKGIKTGLPIGAVTCLRPHRAGIVIQIPELSASGQLLVLDSVEFISLVRLKWDYNYL